MARKKASKGSCSRKRNSEESPPLSNEPKKRRLIQEKNDNYEQELSKKDKYCWICHSNELTDDMWYFWPCCPRIYHFDCMSDYPTSKSEITCPECQLECVDGTELSKPVPRIKLNEFLLFVIQKYLKDDKNGKKSNDKKKTEKTFKLPPVFIQWPPHAETDLIKVVDFTYLINNIRNDNYSKASEFFSDVKWILHNCHLLYGDQSTVTKDAGKLVQLIKADLLDIEACHECCYHGSQKPGFFIKLCDPPHQIIWAKISGYPYWAAKCLKVSHEAAYVKFFGSHEIGKLAVRKCYYISRNHPNYPKPAPKTNSYKDSMTEFGKYVELYKKTHGRESFIYYVDKTVFITENAVKENQEIPLNLMRTLQEDSSSPVISSINLASDDLRLGADFSNLNHPASELSEDQMSSIDRPVIANSTQTMPSSLYFNRREPSNFNEYNSLVHPQVEEIPSSGDTVEARSNQMAARANPTLNQINAVIRFFSNGNAHAFSPQMIIELIGITKSYVRDLQRCKRPFPSQREILLIQQNEELKNQLLKQRSQFEEEKREHGEMIRNERESEVMEHRDRAQNAHMLLRNIRIDTSEAMKEKEKEYKNNLHEKDILVEEYKDKLRMMEAENIELKKELENIELKKELESDSINTAKRNLYCYVCLKSANILCCIFAAYCSKSCQVEDEERHKITCVRENPLMSQRECTYERTYEFRHCEQMQEVTTSSLNLHEMKANKVKTVQSSTSVSSS